MVIVLFVCLFEQVANQLTSFYKFCLTSCVGSGSKVNSIFKAFAVQLGSAPCTQLWGELRVDSSHTQNRGSPLQCSPYILWLAGAHFPGLLARRTRFSQRWSCLFCCLIILRDQGCPWAKQRGWGVGGGNQINKNTGISHTPHIHFSDHKALFPDSSGQKYRMSLRVLAPCSAAVEFCNRGTLVQGLDLKRKNMEYYEASLPYSSAHRDPYSQSSGHKDRDSLRVLLPVLIV